MNLRSCVTHVHDYCEIVLNTEGEGISRIGEKEYAFSPGSIFCIPPHVPHNKKSKDGFYDIYFHTDWIPILRKYGNEPIILQDDADKSMDNLLRILLHSHFKGPSQTDTLLFRTVMQLLSDWLSDGQADPAVEQIENRLIASFSDPELRVEQILAESGYSPDYIRRRFEESTGMTPGKYLTSLRIGYAKDLLHQKEKLRLGIGDIAVMCGFYDPHYFSRCFKKETGVSPNRYCFDFEQKRSE